VVETDGLCDPRREPYLPVLQHTIAASACPKDAHPVAHLTADATAHAQRTADINAYLTGCGYRPDETVSVNWKHKTRSGAITLASEFVKVRDAATEILKHQDRDCYVSAGTFATIPEKGRGTKVNIGRIVALFADLDYKFWTDSRDAEAIEQANTTLEDVVNNISDLIDVNPCAIVYTGGGLHPRWRLDDDIDDDTLERFGALVAQVCREYGGDADGGVYERARVLRAPGSVNHRGKLETGKYTYGRAVETETWVKGGVR
jgi:hypothetical protein